MKKKVEIGESSSSRALFGHLLTVDAIGKLVGVMQTDTSSFRFPFSLSPLPRTPDASSRFSACANTRRE